MHPGMRNAIATAILALLVVPTAHADPASVAPVADSQPEFVYIGVNDRDRPFLDYEGDGLVIQSLVKQAERGDPFELELVVIDLDPSRETYVLGMDVEDRVKTRLRAKAVRVGKDGFRLTGDVEVQGPTRIQFVQMQREGDDETFPELGFDAGKHTVSFGAKVVGWLEP